MYRRYTNVNREGSSPNQIKQVRIRDIIIVLLLAGLVFTTYKTITGANRQKEERSMYIQRMTSECNETMNNDVKSLSRYNAGDSAQILARIRSHLYAIQTLNNAYMEQNRRFLVSEEQLDTLMKMVDDYLYDISKGGQNTAVQQTELNSAMERLQAELNNLE